MWTVPPLEITEQERGELERRVRAHTTAQRMVRRCKVVLMAADGVPNRRIAPVVKMSEEYVSMWRQRFEGDRLAGLEDKQRSGRPRRYGHDERLKVVEMVTSRRPEVESQWSHRLIAEALADDIGISESQVGRILADLDLKPHRVRNWLTRPADPEFWDRAGDVCGLYLHQPGDNALVLSVDGEDGDTSAFSGATDKASPTRADRTPRVRVPP